MTIPFLTKISGGSANGSSGQVAQVQNGSSRRTQLMQPLIDRRAGQIRQYSALTAVRGQHIRSDRILTEDEKQGCSEAVSALSRAMSLLHDSDRFLKFIDKVDKNELLKGLQSFIERYRLEDQQLYIKFDNNKPWTNGSLIFEGGASHFSYQLGSGVERRVGITEKSSMTGSVNQFDGLIRTEWGLQEGQWKYEHLLGGLLFVKGSIESENVLIKGEWSVDSSYESREQKNKDIFSCYRYAMNYESRMRLEGLSNGSKGTFNGTIFIKKMEPYVDESYKSFSVDGSAVCVPNLKSTDQTRTKEVEASSKVTPTYRYAGQWEFRYCYNKAPSDVGRVVNLNSSDHQSMYRLLQGSYIEEEVVAQGDFNLRDSGVELSIQYPKSNDIVFQEGHFVPRPKLSSYRFHSSNFNLKLKHGVQKRADGTEARGIYVVDNVSTSKLRNGSVKSADGRVEAGLFYTDYKRPILERGKQVNADGSTNEGHFEYYEDLGQSKLHYGTQLDANGVTRTGFWIPDPSSQQLKFIPSLNDTADSYRALLDS